MWDDGVLWSGVEKRELLLRECCQCHTICHPPLPMCPNCQSLDWQTRAASGRAVLISWLLSTNPQQTKPQQPNAQQLNDQHRIVIVVRLEEGVNFVSNLIDTPIEKLYEDMPLELCFDNIEGQTLPLFRCLQDVRNIV